MVDPVIGFPIQPKGKPFGRLGLPGFYSYSLVTKSHLCYQLKQFMHQIQGEIPQNDQQHLQSIKFDSPKKNGESPF